MPNSKGITYLPNVRRLVGICCPNGEIGIERRIAIINTVYDTFRRCASMENALGHIGLFIGDTEDDGMGELYSVKTNAVDTIWTALERSDESEKDEIYDILRDAVDEDAYGKTISNDTAKKLIALLEDANTKQGPNKPDEK